MLQLVARGMTKREIAEKLSLSEKTIRNRVSEMLSKLDLKNRTELAIWAWKSGIAERRSRRQERQL